MGNPSTAGKTDAIAEGDVVRWITDAKAVWREEYGDGPFIVIAANPLPRSRDYIVSSRFASFGTVELGLDYEDSLDQDSWTQYDGLELWLVGPDGTRVPVPFNSTWFVKTTLVNTTVST